MADDEVLEVTIRIDSTNRRQCKGDPRFKAKQGSLVKFTFRDFHDFAHIEFVNRSPFLTKGFDLNGAEAVLQVRRNADIRNDYEFVVVWTDADPSPGVGNGGGEVIGGR